MQLIDYMHMHTSIVLPPGVDEDQLVWGFRLHVTMGSAFGYVWPDAGHWAEAPGPILDHDEPCPKRIGDGICVGITVRGAQSGWQPLDSPMALVVAYLPEDVLGSNQHKTRVRRAWVAGVIHDWDKRLSGADLEGADLVGANLVGAHLEHAHLEHAHLEHAHLADAELVGAYLMGAHLTGAYLEDANLVGANLADANLKHAYLRNANLTGAYLRNANLTGAYLWGANLVGTNLEGVKR